MITLEGHYFDGDHPVAVQGKMEFFAQEATLTAESVSESYEKKHLRVSPRIVSTDRFITLPNGGQFSCADNPFLDLLPQESQSEGPVAWLEDRWFVALACVAIIFSLLVTGYLFGLPAAAERIAYRIPMETERSLGEQALIFLDKQGWFAQTNLAFDTRKEIMEGFDLLWSDLPLRGYYRLEFRSSAMFGPNALALPGAIIVITDEMVEAAETKEEVMSVLAHEMGHVELRHIMRSVLQNSVIGVTVATLTSDAASLSGAVTGFPVVIAQTKFSRDFETEADEYAFELLKQKGYSPNAFASLMERLLKGKELETAPFSWLSTHPVTSERIQRARESAAE